MSRELTRCVLWVLRGTLVALVTIGAVGAETLTVGTYNLQNYGPANRMTAAGFRPEYPKPEAQKRALRTVIRTLDADVLAMQEMGPEPYLRELQRDLRAEGCDYPHVALATAADAERHVALLSRRPLRDVSTLDLSFVYFGSRERVKRGVLHAVIETEVGKLDIFAIHLKSRLTERPDDPLCTMRRTAEARAVRDAILKRFPEPAQSRFLIVGDCNDSTSSPAVQRLLRRGATEIAVVVPAFDTRRESWTYFFAREETYSRVDHVFVSPALREAVTEGVGRIPDGDGVAAASDHRPVIVRLRMER